METATAPTKSMPAAVAARFSFSYERITGELLDPVGTRIPNDDHYAIQAFRDAAETGVQSFTFHPRFDGVPRLHGWQLEHVEGGDVLLLAPGVIAIGVGERTTPAGVERFARRAFAEDVAHTILAVPITQERATMHLDTVLTMVDADALVVYPNAADSLTAYAVTCREPHDDESMIELAVAAAEPFLVAAAKATQGL